MFNIFNTNPEAPKTSNPEPGPTTPRTPEGKAHSSQTAVKAGIFSQLKFVPEIDRNYFTRFEEALRLDLTPANAIEEIWFQQLLTAYWRIQRCNIGELNLRRVLRPGEEPMTADGTQSLMKIYDLARSTALRQLHTAQTGLSRLQTERLHREHLAALRQDAIDATSSVLANTRKFSYVNRNSANQPKPSNGPAVAPVSNPIVA